MPINSKKVLNMLKSKLNSMSLSELDATSESKIDQELCDNILMLVDSLNSQQSLHFEEINELINDEPTDDFEFEPVFENLNLMNETFSLDYICKVLRFKEDNPNYSFSTIQHNFRRVKARSYLHNFKEYRDNLGTQREKYKLIAKHCYERFVEARQSGIIIHDRTIRSWAITKARQLETLNFNASHG